MTGPIVSTDTATLPDDRRWRRLVIVLGLVSAAVLLAGSASALAETLPAALVVVGLGLWLVELLSTPPWVVAEAVLLAAVGVTGGLLNALAPESSGFLLAYLAAAATGLRLPVRYGLPALGLALVVLAAGVVRTSETVLTSLPTDLLGVAFAFLVATATRTSRRAQARNAELVVQLEATRAAEAEAAALAERARLARELHDILAHALSGLAMSLEAARLLAEQSGADARLVEELTRAQRLARDGLVDARRAVATLRGDTLPGPGLLEDLVDNARSVPGLDVTLAVRGTPRPVPADVALTIHRTAQEALTNAGKYAGRGARVRCQLVWGDDTVSLSVQDEHGDAARGPREGTLPSGGYGLTGLRERAELAGGTLRAAPTDSGFGVHLSLPYGPPGSPG